MFDELPRGDRRQIRRFLQAVEKDMRAGGAERTETAMVTAALGEQILEAKASAAPNTSIEDILGGIDAPVEFGGVRAPTDRGSAWLGHASLIAAVATAILSFAVIPGTGLVSEENGGVLFVIGEFLAVGMGVAGRKTGTGLAGLICGGACLALFFLAAAFGAG